MGSNDCLFGLANTYGFSSAMRTVFLVLTRTSIELIMLGVKMTVTFLPPLSRISTMSSLKTTTKNNCLYLWKVHPFEKVEFLLDEGANRGW